MVVLPGNALCIQLPKYHNNEDLVLHIRHLTKMCMTNGENTNDHKLQYFPNSLKGRTVDWFKRYETTHPTVAWAEVERAFITQFSEIKIEGKTSATLRYVKQKKYELMEDYYDRFLRLCVIIP